MFKKDILLISFTGFLLTASYTQAMFRPADNTKPLGSRGIRPRAAMPLPTKEKIFNDWKKNLRAIEEKLLGEDVDPKQWAFKWYQENFSPITEEAFFTAIGHAQKAGALLFHTWTLIQNAEAKLPTADHSLGKLEENQKVELNLYCQYIKKLHKEILVETLHVIQDIKKYGAELKKRQELEWAFTNNLAHRRKEIDKVIKNLSSVNTIKERGLILNKIKEERKNINEYVENIVEEMRSKKLNSEKCWVEIRNLRMWTLAIEKIMRKLL